MNGPRGSSLGYRGLWSELAVLMVKEPPLRFGLRLIAFGIAVWIIALGSGATLLAALADEAAEAGDEDRIYDLSLPICALVALQLQGGLDGFLAIEKYLLQKRGLFPNTVQLQPVGWKIDRETQDEVDRLFTRLQAVL